MWAVLPEWKQERNLPYLIPFVMVNVFCHHITNQIVTSILLKKKATSKSCLIFKDCYFFARIFKVTTSTPFSLRLGLLTENSKLLSEINEPRLANSKRCRTS